MEAARTNLDATWIRWSTVALIAVALFVSVPAPLSTGTIERLFVPSVG